MKTTSAVLATVLTAGAAFAEPVLPGYLTDPTANWKELAPDGSALPASLRYPYIAVHSVKPTFFVGEKCVLGWYVTDFDHSLVRFGDESFRFDVELKLTTDRANFTSRWQRNVPSRDGEFDLGALPAGDYYAGLRCVDRKSGLSSHVVWQEFRVVAKDFFDIPADKTLTVTDDTLARYGIVSDPGYEHRCPIKLTEDDKTVKAKAKEQKIAEHKYLRAVTDAYLAAHPHVPDAKLPGYTTYVPARKGVPVACAFACMRTVFDPGYDTNLVARVAEANSLGLQRLLDEAASNGFRKVVMKPGRYRVSHLHTLAIPDRFTFDLGGATLKLQGFVGCSSMMVKLAAVTDSHLVNGTLEGDYWEHDYAAKESQGSEWVCGFDIRSCSKYCSVENVKLLDITGYGGCAGMGKEGPDCDKWCPYHWLLGRNLEIWSKKLGGVKQGALNPEDGTVREDDPDQVHTGFVDISCLERWGYLQAGWFGGYQGNHLRGWGYSVAYYDAGTNYISGEIGHLFRHSLIPRGAKYARFSVGAKTDAKSLPGVQLVKWPRNCEIRNCVFDRSRAVGLVPCHSTNLRVVSNEFVRCGESLAKCAFDAEDGWECAHDMLLEGNDFHDNPNNELLTCAGLNFQIVGNRASLHLYARTHSAYVANNDCGSLTVGASSRVETGYTRLVGNRIRNGLGIGGLNKGYTDWDIVLSDLTFRSDGSDRRLSVGGGPCGRYRNCTFDGVDLRVASAENCVIRNCQPKMGAVRPDGRWTDCTMENSMFSAYLGSMFFVRCRFKDSRLSTNAAKFTLDGCTCAGTAFGSCRNVKGGSYAFRNCELKDSKTDLAKLDATYENCKGAPKAAASTAK